MGRPEPSLRWMSMACNSQERTNLRHSICIMLQLGAVVEHLSRA